MPDLGAAVGGMLDLFGPIAKQLLGPLIKALLRLTLGTLFLASLLLGGAYYLASRNPHGHPLFAVLITFLACVILGTMLVIKRTVLSALRFGIARLQLGQRTVGALFARALGVQASESAQAGERGNRWPAPSSACRSARSRPSCATPRPSCAARRVVRAASCSAACTACSSTRSSR
jgi:hypothetical protein